MFCKIFGFLLFHINIIALCGGEIFKECEGRKNETYVELQDDCTFYIFCHGEDSFGDTCPEESPYFSIEDQVCDSDKRVCNGRPIPSEIAEFSTVQQQPEISTDAASNTPAISTTSSTQSSTTTSVFTNPPSTSAASTIFQTVSTTSLSPLVPSSCPPVDNRNKVIFLPHTRSCTEYFLCYQGVRVPLHCSNRLHFNARQQKCDYPENAKCYLMDVASAREQCSPHTFDVYPHPRNCNYYYQCIFGYLRVMQCPWNMDWHYEKRACVLRSQAKCYNTFAKSTLALK